MYSLVFNIGLISARDELQDLKRWNRVWGDRDKEMQIPFQEEMQIPIKANPIRSTFLVDRYQSWSTCPLLQNLQNISAIWFKLI